MIRPDYLDQISIAQFIDSALAEDIGDGDYSTLAVTPHNPVCCAHLLIKEDGVIAGLQLAGMILHHIDPELSISFHYSDGDVVRKGDVGFTITGKASTILTCERLVLNCMQRMSGIATYTKRLCQIIEGTSARLMDTRKTTPNFRMMEKWAVAIGGGINHRFALYDMIMLKDNHIDLAGGIGPAMALATQYLRTRHKKLKIEVEVRSLDEVREAIQVGGMDVIMLDNMGPELIHPAVRIIDGKYKTEASGGITESNLLVYAKTGVDYISVGALTHSVKSLDLSLKISSQ